MTSVSAPARWVLVASPGASGLVGDGAWVFPGVVVAMLALAVVCLRARGVVIRVFTILCGLSVAWRGGRDLMSATDDGLGGYYVAWVVAGLGATAAAGWAFVRDRRWRVDDA